MRSHHVGFRSPLIDQQLKRASQRAAGTSCSSSGGTAGWDLDRQPRLQPRSIVGCGGTPNADDGRRPLGWVGRRLELRDDALVSPTSSASRQLLVPCACGGNGNQALAGVCAYVQSTSCYHLPAGGWFAVGKPGSLRPGQYESTCEEVMHTNNG